jgi:hypothetical protein
MSTERDVCNDINLNFSELFVVEIPWLRHQHIKIREVPVGSLEPYKGSACKRLVTAIYKPNDQKVFDKAFSSLHLGKLSPEASPPPPGQGWPPFIYVQHGGSDFLFHIASSSEWRDKMRMWPVSDAIKAQPELRIDHSARILFETIRTYVNRWGDGFAALMGVTLIGLGGAGLAYHKGYRVH